MVTPLDPITLHRREKRKAATRKKHRGPTEMDRINAKWHALEAAERAKAPKLSRLNIGKRDLGYLAPKMWK